MFQNFLSLRIALWAVRFFCFSFATEYDMIIKIKKENFKEAKKERGKCHLNGQKNI